MQGYCIHKYITDKSLDLNQGLFLELEIDDFQNHFSHSFRLLYVLELCSSNVSHSFDLIPNSYNYRIYLFNESLSTLKYTKSKNQVITSYNLQFQINYEGFSTIVGLGQLLGFCLCILSRWLVESWRILLHRVSIQHDMVLSSGGRFKIEYFISYLSTCLRIVLLGEGWIPFRNKKS